METNAVGIAGIIGLIVGASLTIATVWAGNRTKPNRITIKEAERITREAEHKTREEKKKRDQQLNHGRRVFNWLQKNLLNHHDFESRGLRVIPIEDNGGVFSIHIVRMEDGGSRTPILQISYDFLKHQKPYLGHIHYGACGADILFWVDPLLQMFDIGLQELVIEEVHRHFYFVRHL